MSDKSMLSLLFEESKAYSSLQDIEKLVNDGRALTSIPMQPLYLSIRNSTPQLVAQLLPRLSREQRTTLLDLDLWKKDDVDLERFQFWPMSYYFCEDEKVREEFLSSEHFLLFLKGRFTISTFDIEDPVYPEHDFYFLTEDRQLLLEYDKTFPYPDELQEMVKQLYTVMGVENAYAFLFKMVVDGYLNIQEEQYQRKIARLREYGFVDYFEGLEIEATFPSQTSIKGFIKNKIGATGRLEVESRSQALHSSVISSYKGQLNQIEIELQKIKSEERQDFINFSFIRLVNASLASTQALFEGSVAINRIGTKTRSVLSLGHEYVKSYLDELGLLAEPKYKEGLFAQFDFIDIYRIGNSLIKIVQKKLKKELRGSVFEEEETESFLGLYWCHYLENSFHELPKYKTWENSKMAVIDNLRVYESWRFDCFLLSKIIPYITNFWAAFHKLKAEDLVHDDFYYNYNVSEIDFEAIIISSFINYALGHYEASDSKRMGLTLEEFRSFVTEFMILVNSQHEMIGNTEEKLASKLNGFCEKFGFTDVNGFDYYLYKLMDEHLSGYDFFSLSEPEFKYVGGPILLTNQQDLVC